MPFRTEKPVENQAYHLFNRSIAGYRILEHRDDAERFFETILYYNDDGHKTRFSLTESGERLIPSGAPIVKIIAYCIMPTHFHLVLEPLLPDAVSHMLNLVLKSFSRYFNVRHNRRGPLWEGRFKLLRVDTTEELLHLTRYVHLNPVTSYLCEKPEDWALSSYREYIGVRCRQVCDFSGRLEISSSSYSVFVNERASYQRELAKIKHLLF